MKEEEPAGAAEVKPTANTHVFVGTFRPTPQDISAIVSRARADAAYKIYCPLGHGNYDANGIWKCWSNGCYDTPVYKTIEEVVRMKQS